MADHDSLNDRVSQLESRVRDLERARAGSKQDPGETVAPQSGAVGPDDNETFWALNGLVEQMGPSGGVAYTGHVTPPGSDSPVSWQMGLAAAELEDVDFSGAAEILSAVGHPVRLSLLQAIYEGKTTTAQLGADERFGTTGQIYHHLHALSGAGWLENARRGHWRIPAQRIIPLLTLVLIGTH